MVKKNLETKQDFEETEEKVQKSVDMKISDLPGIGPVRTKKLEEAGITTIMSLSCRNPNDVSSISGLSTEECGDLIGEARKICDPVATLEQAMQTAGEVEKFRTAERWQADAGCKGLNDLFRGGIDSQTITEFYGLNGSGKTQICFTAGAIVANEGGQVLYIDTENTFSAKRIREIAIARSLDEDKVMTNIIKIRAYDASHQVKITEGLGDYMQDQIKSGTPVKMIVVDSVTANFRSEYEGRGQLAPRQQLLNRHLKLLQRYAEAFNIPVLLANQVLSNAEGVFGDPIKAVGGNIMGHRSTFRVYLRKGSKTKRVALMDDSPEHPRNEVVYYLTTEGVSDSDQK